MAKSLAESLGNELPTPEEVAESFDEHDTVTVKDFAKKILTSADYRKSIERRIITDTLPAALECKLYDYAWGKPVDKVEVRDVTERLEDLSSEELEAKAMSLATLASTLRTEKTTVN